MNPQTIILAVANSTATTPEQIKSRKESEPIKSARQLAAYALWKNTDLTLEKIGEAIGGRSHSTAFKLRERARFRLKSEESMRLSLRGAMESITNPTPA